MLGSTILEVRLAALPVCALQLAIVLTASASTSSASPSAASCPVGNTACAGGCCPNEFPGAGSCCADGLTCCSAGYTCSPSGSAALCVAKNATAHPLAGTTPRYRLCEGPSELRFLDGVKGSRKRFPYYSNRPQPLATADSGLVMAAVVVHGAGRNADDYYCAMNAAAKLQTSYAAASVGIFAPRFWETLHTQPIKKIQLRMVRSDGLPHSPIGSSDRISADIFMLKKYKAPFLAYVEANFKHVTINPGKHSN